VQNNFMGEGVCSIVILARGIELAQLRFRASGRRHTIHLAFVFDFSRF
jgi:hypothetical protein